MRHIHIKMFDIIGRNRAIFKANEQVIIGTCMVSSMKQKCLSHAIYILIL